MNVIVRTFLKVAYISKPTRNCHNNSQLRWDHVCNGIHYIEYTVHLLTIQTKTTTTTTTMALILSKSWGVNTQKNDDDDDDDDRKEAAVVVAVTVAVAAGAAAAAGEEEEDDDDDDDKGRKTLSATLPTSTFDVWEEAIETSKDVRECYLIKQELERLLQKANMKKNSLAAVTSMR